LLMPFGNRQWLNHFWIATNFRNPLDKEVNHSALKVFCLGLAWSMDLFTRSCPDSWSVRGERHDTRNDCTQWPKYRKMCKCLFSTDPMV
jgi:hypothetical protein